MLSPRTTRPEASLLERRSLVASYLAASCGGAPIGILKAYIEQQKKPL